MTNPRNRIDWDKAEAFYLNLDPPRKIATVARQFGVSGNTVRKWAKRLGWDKKAVALDRKALDQATGQAVRSRAQRVAAALNFTDEFLDAAQAKLAQNKLDVRAGDVPALVKLAELLEGEATDRVQIGEVRVLVAQVVVVAGEFIAKEDRPAFMARLGELTAGLGEAPS
ncbi:MAG: phage terminase small subunit-related protein [Chloroflexota bacterium]|nr:phage terminase small subunit-related protein [Chloroflexota bacterium]